MLPKVGGTLLCALIALSSYPSCACEQDEGIPKGNGEKPATCIVWGSTNVKTFNGNVHSFKSTCGYTLATFPVVGAQFEIIFRQNPFSLLIKYNGDYELKQSGSSTVFSKNGRMYNFPTTLDGIKVSQPGSLVIVNILDLGLKIKWDKSDTAEVIVSDKNRPISGLCGENNRERYAYGLFGISGERANSILDFVDSWSEGGCKARTNPTVCSGRQALLAKAQVFCKNLFSDTKFSKCQDEYAPFMNTCMSNYCICTLKDRNDCMCAMLDTFVRTCKVNKELESINWRDAKFCRKNCANPDQGYMTCAPNKRQLSCGEEEVANPMDDCEEGCYCPQGFRLSGNRCLLLNECPCFYDDKEYGPGARVAQECKDCICKNGVWNCPNKICTVTANCGGDPHYTTFDGRKYDFMGKCMYYVVRTSQYDVICDHYIRKGDVFLKDFQSSAPSMCKRVIINVHQNGDEIVLGFNNEVKYNGRKLTWFPRQFSGILISQASSEVVLVQLANYMDVRFDGKTVASVTIPTTMKGRVRGLFGTYTKNPGDDFQLPNGTIVTDPTVFGNSWKVPGSCTNEFTGTVVHPCIVNPNIKPIAEKACSLLKNPTFAGCSEHSEEEYENCLYDACNCIHNPQECACDILAMQGERCARKGKPVEWRQNIPECAITCPAGQEYTVCGNPCTRSCDDIAFNPTCEKDCVEGCRCPEGKVLNERNECVPVSECKCWFEQSCYPPAYKYRTDKKLSTCTDAKWSEKDATIDEKITVPDIRDLQEKCKQEEFLQFTGCKASNPSTCHNMHEHQRPIYHNCKEGCQCIEGFVLDPTTGLCTRPDDCPCLHNGISYKENAVRRDKNQKCTCKDSIWKCVQEDLPWKKCSVWGNINVRMFSGAIYSFTGNCHYVLFSENRVTGTTRIILEIERCTSGSCIKSVKIEHNAESIEITTCKEPTTSANLQNLVMTSYDFSTVIDIKGEGIKFVWNKNGWLHLHLQRNFHTQRQNGLCGPLNYEGQDVVAPDGTRVSDLVDKARLNNECPKAVELPAIEPDTLLLPGYTCDALFDEVFQTCRAIIPVGEYYKRCLIRANELMVTQITDNDYHCSTLAAYAQECNDLGVPVNWRKKNICPVQCQKGFQYDKCIRDKDGVCYEGCVREGAIIDGSDGPTVIKLTCNDANKPCKKVVEINIDGDGVCNGNNQYTLVFNVGGKTTTTVGASTL